VHDEVAAGWDHRIGGEPVIDPFIQAPTGQIHRTVAAVEQFHPEIAVDQQPFVDGDIGDGGERRGDIDGVGRGKVNCQRSLTRPMV